MRKKCRQTIDIRGTVIGGDVPLVCLPLVADDRDSLLQQAGELMDMGPDLLEWRVDGFGASGETPVCLDALCALRRVTQNVPLIFTCRIDQEGGMRSLSQASRLQLISAAMETGWVDIVDIELCNDLPFIETIRRRARRHGVKLILSSHDFEKTPEAAVIVERLVRAQALGADIAKVAVMPGDAGDVLTLLNATFKAGSEAIDIPIVTISMGTLGAVSRIAGGVFGSDITFAVGDRATAPGQIPIRDLRHAMQLL